MARPRNINARARVAGVLGLAAAAVFALAPGTAGALERTQILTSPTIRLAGYQTKEPDVTVPAPKVEGSILGVHAYLVDLRGRRVDQTDVMLHHAVFINRGRFDGDRRSDYCGDRPREPFYGTAEEDQALRLPRGYGYPIHAGDRWQLRYMAMNHKARERTVRLRYVVTTTTGPVTPVTPYWVSVACLRQRIYSVAGGGPAGSEDVRSAQWRVPRTGRIVAMAGHLHGGGKRVDLLDADCGNRLMASSTARYGAAADPIYAMSPMLHEPSPRSVGVTVSSAGWPVRAGQRLRVDSVYDNARPHVKVMGIAHIYVAEGGPAPAPCPPPPVDAFESRISFPGAPGRAEPPFVRQDLSRRDARGVGRPIAGLAGPVVTRDAPEVTVDVRNFAFAPRRLSVAAGTRIRWRFQDRQQHDVSWVEGPRGFASRYLKRGDGFATRLTEPGSYRLFCSLHPVDMPATIDVRAPAAP